MEGGLAELAGIGAFGESKDGRFGFSDDALGRGGIGWEMAGVGERGGDSSFGGLLSLVEGVSIDPVDLVLDRGEAKGLGREIGRWAMCGILLIWAVDQRLAHYLPVSAYQRLQIHLRHLEREGNGFRERKRGRGRDGFFSFFFFLVGDWLLKGRVGFGGRVLGG